MRSNATVYIDAGYLLASAATRLTGSSFRRGIEPTYALLIQGIIEQAEHIAERPVLRSYWYDAVQERSANDDHRVIEMIPRVKLRLGRIGNEGQQKGVDLKIGLDMVTHARNGAIDTLVLISGDDDLTEAVDQAQVNGVEVVVLAVPDADGRPHGVSRHLHAAADRLELVKGSVLDAAIVRRIVVETPPIALQSVLHAPAATAPQPEPGAESATEPSPAVHADASARPSPSELNRPRPATPVPGHASPPKAPAPMIAATPVYSTSTLGGGISGYGGLPAANAPDPELTARVAKAVYDAFTQVATASQLSDLYAARPSIPRELDSTLLRDLSDAMGVYTLDEGEKRALRNAFWVAVDDAR